MPITCYVVGNENADRLATAAALDASNASNAEVPFRDWYRIKQFRVKHKWKGEWLAVGTSKLRSLESSIDVWPSICYRDRKISCILTRLRIWHTRLTHQHLMENRPPPYCTDCLVPLTVRHFLAVRHRLLPRIIGEDVDQTLQTMLSENLGEIFDPLWLMQYLQETGMIDIASWDDSATWCALNILCTMRYNPFWSVTDNPFHYLLTWFTLGMI